MYLLNCFFLMIKTLYIYFFYVLTCHPYPVKMKKKVGVNNVNCNEKTWTLVLQLKLSAYFLNDENKHKTFCYKNKSGFIEYRKKRRKSYQLCEQPRSVKTRISQHLIAPTYSFVCVPLSSSLDSVEMFNTSVLVN